MTILRLLLIILGLYLGGLSSHACNAENLLPPEAEEADAKEKPKSHAPPKPVSFLSLQKDLKQTCDWLTKDGQLITIRSLLTPYGEEDGTCKTCRAFARVWLSACKIVVPPKKNKTKKQIAEDKAAAEENASDGSTSSDGSSSSSVAPADPGMAATPSTELLEIFSRLSRQTADQEEMQTDLKGFFWELGKKAPASTKLYLDVISTYFFSAWPEPVTDENAATPEDAEKIKEKKAEDLNNLF